MWYSVCGFADGSRERVFVANDERRITRETHGKRDASKERRMVMRLYMWSNQPYGAQGAQALASETKETH